ncbi:putative peroxiredoxin bcp [compost metagenome]
MLAFFPKAVTPGCEKEMTDFGRELAKFHALGAEVIGVSYDTPETQRKFALHCAASFPFLSDEGGKVADQYHTGGGFGPFKFASRRTFVIDRSGIIRSVQDGMPDMPKLLKDLEGLR